jgi:hypothetical protein
MSRLVLHIDRLVLRGIDRADAAAVAAGLELELRRQLTRAGAEAPLVTGGDRPRVRVGEVRVAGGSHAAATGRAVARGIVGGVTP